MGDNISCLMLKIKNNVIVIFSSLLILVSNGCVGFSCRFVPQKKTNMICCCLRMLYSLCLIIFDVLGLDMGIEE